jgi:hypothetical protein
MKVGYKFVPITAAFLFPFLLNGKKLKMQKDDSDDLSYPMADFEELADLEGDELSEILNRSEFSPEDYKELQDYKKSQSYQPMQFKIIGNMLKQNIDDDLWHGARLNFEWSPSPFFKMDYSLTAEGPKMFKYRTSVMNMIPSITLT